MVQDLVTEKWEDFLKRYYWNEIIELSNSYPEKRSLLVKFSEMDIYDSTIADMLLDDPDVILESATRTLREMDIPTGVTLDAANLRVIKLPRKVKIRAIRSDDIGKLVSIEGLVTKATEVRPKIVEAAFECPFCHHIFSMVQTGSQFKEPYECPQEDGGCGRKAQRFLLRVDKSKFANAQKVRLQESPEELRGGELPQALDVNLEDDISGEVAPGDRVIVTGILRSYQRVTQFGKKLFFDIYLDGNSLELKEGEFEEIEITEEDEKRITELKTQPELYERLIGGIAPFIYGHEEIKEAILLQLFGGSRKKLADGTSLRGNIHVLLVGDPGVAKSQLLGYVAQLAPRGVYVDCKKSSAVGLTASVVKDEFGGGRWSLEAGAMVLADKGVVCGDNIDMMKKDDKDVLQEPLEQQMVSIAKAGITARLNSRCAFLGAANPKHGRFDRYAPISDQIDMSPPLLSRFDLIFIMLDKAEEERDRQTAQFVFNSHSTQHKEEQLPRDLLRKYIAYSRRIEPPQLSEDAKRKIEEFYVDLRKQSYTDDAPIPITVRQLESLIRLGEARARARLSDVVSAEDADRVIQLVTTCLHGVYVDPETGQLDVDWVVAGTTKTRRDRAKTLRTIISDLEREYGEEIPTSEVLDLAEEEGMERDKAEEIIDVMKRDGILFSPGSGMIKFVR